MKGIINTTVYNNSIVWYYTPPAPENARLANYGPFVHREDAEVFGEDFEFLSGEQWTPEQVRQMMSKDIPIRYRGFGV